MASASYLDSGDEMSGMTWGDCGLNAFLCSPSASPFADKDPVFGHEWAGFDTHPMDVEAVALPMLTSLPLEPTYSFSPVALARSGSGKVMEAQDEEVFVLPETVKKRPREKSKVSQRKKARKEEDVDSHSLKRKSASKQTLSNYRAILDSKTTRLTSDERELIRRYVVLLEKAENKRKSCRDIMRVLQPHTSDLDSFFDKTAEQLRLKLCRILSEYKRGDRDIFKVKVGEDARVEVNKQALSDFRAMRDSDSIRLSSDERELIRRYVSLLETEEHQRKLCTDMMRIIRPLIGHLESFCENTAEELQAKIWKIRFEYKKGDRDISKVKACEDALLEKHEQTLSDFRAMRDSDSIRLSSDERELIRRYVVLLETEEHQRTPILQIVRILRPLTSDLPSCCGKTSDKLNSKLSAIRSEYKRGDRDISKVKAREDARLEKHEQALTDYRAILDSKTTRLTSDERELIRRYVVLLETEEHQRKSCRDIMSILRSLIGDLKSFCYKTAEQLRAKIWKIRFEYNRGDRDLTKTKAR
jgi:hypothetical protein